MPVKTRRRRHARTIALRRYMKRHKLTRTRVGSLACCSRQAVTNWLKEAPIIPERALRLLTLQLKR